MQEHFNTCEFLLDRRLSAGDAPRVAIRHAATDLTYADVAELVARAANAFRQLDVRAEERVPLVVLDSPEFVAAFLALLRIGAVPVPLSTMLLGADLAGLADDARARVVVGSGALGQQLAEMADAPDVQHLVVIGDSDVEAPRRVSTHAWTQVMADATPVPVARTVADGPAFWLYTSGTTGRPKGAMHRHADLPFAAESYGRGVLGITRDDRVFSVARLFFAYGLGNALAFPFSVGATTILDPARPTPQSVAELVAEERPTLFFAVPTFYAGLVASDVPDDSCTSVRQGISAGEPLPAELLRRVRDRFGIEVLDGIGSTEATHIFISNRPGEVRPGASGTLVDSWRAKVVDDAGAEVPDGEIGHLVISGPSIATGYWCRTDATRATFQGEWLRTGDVYTRGADAVFTYAGRSDDMLKVGGIWVSPAEVEAVLVEHPAVVEAAVVGEADENGLTKPVAYIVKRPDGAADPAELVTHCEARLAGYKRPRRIELVDELPKTATGKIQRFRLRGGADRPAT